MERSEAKRESVKKLAESVCKALESRGFQASFAADKESACKEALKLIGDGATVGVPGSVTVREIGLIERLEARGCKISQHWQPNLTPEQKTAVLLAELQSDWFVTSANALSLDGVIVNIDGAGNRVGAMAWAPGKILYIVGINKITSNVHSAVRRARDIAAPPNALRLGNKTPCATVGHCMDCKSPDRMCRVFSIIERAPMGRECHVIIVGEELGY